ncbi:MAG: hypothetical protein IV108_05030 [Burkholderiales bacterium]|nr:hypothetical protein [Burkholderiales bacterium]
MQLKKIVLACAAALTLPMTAHAVAPANAFDTAGALTVFMSGATAPDEFLQGIMTGMLNPGFYSFTNVSTAGTEYRAFLGEIKADASIPANLHNQKILFIKRSKNGSVFGVNPVARDQNIQTMNLSATVCTSAQSVDTATAPSVPTDFTNPTFVISCPTIGQDPSQGNIGGEMKPDFGVSDVNPFMFKEPFNVEYLATQLAPNEVAGLTVRSVNTLMMGYATTAAVPETTILSKADYAGMLSKNIKQWSKVGATMPAGKDGVVVCRRWPGSGTQTSYNWYFNNFPCTSASATSGVSGDVAPGRMDESFGFASYVNGDGSGVDAANSIGIDPSAGYTIIENSGSGDVRKCLKAAQAGTKYSFKGEDNLFYEADFSIGAGGYGAIAVLSLDSQTKTSDGAESSWFFRPAEGKGRFYKATQDCRIGGAAGAVTESGVCPNRSNLRDGHYDFAAELTMQYLTSKHAVGSQKLSFINELIDRAGDPALQALWTLALPPTYLPTATIGVEGYDGALVAKANRDGDVGNMCKPLARKY